MATKATKSTNPTKPKTSSSATRTKKPAGVKPAPTLRTRLGLRRPEARKVCVAGSFNNWDATLAPLQLADDGRWTIELDLAPGVYEYRFVADGEWIHDPEATENVPNPFGGLNSVLRVVLIS